MEQRKRYETPLMEIQLFDDVLACGDSVVMSPDVEIDDPGGDYDEY